ncbi:MAG: flagellar basal body rod protein FlgB [Melioribacteraceae bacterium]|jgi:flagellar basal-body rod protein FlgB|nr:flagellar basal body rod protein FlgB [Melioribacteraceae bacterium]
MSNSVKLLHNLLDYCSEKNKVISKNIANIGTEKYNREDIVFNDLLNDNVNSLVKTSNSKHLSSLNIQENGSSKFKVVEDSSEESISGANNVSIEREMAELAENTLRFRFASKKVGDYYRQIQNVIKGSGRA